MCKVPHRTLCSVYRLGRDPDLPLSTSILGLHKGTGHEEPGKGPCPLHAHPPLPGLLCKLSWILPRGLSWATVTSQPDSVSCWLAVFGRA